MALLASIAGHAWMAHLAGGGSAALRSADALSRELTVVLDIQASPIGLIASESEEAQLVARPVVSAMRPVDAPAGRNKATTQNNSRPVERAAGVGDPNYYGARELDVYPELQAPLDLSAVRGLIARIELLLLVDENGRVQDVSVTGGGDSAAEALRSAFLGAVFTPALRDGRRVKSRLRVEVGSAEP